MFHIEIKPSWYQTYPRHAVHLTHHFSTDNDNSIMYQGGMKNCESGSRKTLLTDSGTNPKLGGLRGGGFTAEYFENKISSYELEVMTRTCTNIFGEVFGPCAHCCPCEALEQKRPKKHKP